MLSWCLCVCAACACSLIPVNQVLEQLVQKQAVFAAAATAGTSPAPSAQPTPLPAAQRAPSGSGAPRISRLQAAVALALAQGLLQFASSPAATAATSAVLPATYGAANTTTAYTTFDGLQGASISPMPSITLDMVPDPSSALQDTDVAGTASSTPPSPHATSQAVEGHTVGGGVVALGAAGVARRVMALLMVVLGEGDAEAQVCVALLRKYANLK